MMAGQRGGGCVDSVLQMVLPPPAAAAARPLPAHLTAHETCIMKK
jgi:hypothetical protein